MYTAKEARAKTESVNSTNRVWKETKICEAKINSAIEDGITFAIVEEHISDKTKEYLESLGYRIEYYLNMTYIYW